MAKYVVRRFLLIPFSLMLVLTLAYAYAHVVQWDYAARYPHLQRQLQTTQRPESLTEAYRDYVEGLLRLDFGRLQNGQSIIVVIRQALIASLGLLAAALVLSVPLGILLGVIGAQWRRLRPARWLMVLSTAGLAMPSFYVGSLLILLSVAYLLLRKGQGGLPFPLVGFGWGRHMVLPVIALMARPTVQTAQVTATLLTGELQKPYVAAARSMGHSKKHVKWHLAFRNILAPVTLTIATSIRTLVADLILVEWLFFWPGLGRFTAAALIPPSRTNMAVSPYLLNPEFVALLLTMVTLIFLIADFVASVSVRVFDPRLRVPVMGDVDNV
jgi:ABC-type dipeptide/oligopeptide/nickel transport system permease component